MRHAILLLALAFVSAPCAAGYAMCSDGGSTWVQSGTCPGSVEKRVFMACSGSTTTGDRFNGQCSRVESVAVQSRELSRSEFCDALSAGYATSAKPPKSSSDAAYERNSLKQRERC